MLAHLDRILETMGLGAIVAPMHERMHASFRWLTRGARVTRGYAIKAVGRDTVFVCHPMERDEAAASGLTVMSVSDFGFEKIVAEESSQVSVYSRFYQRVLGELGIEGAVGFVGEATLQLYHEVLPRLAEAGIAHVGDLDIWQGAELGNVRHASAVAAHDAEDELAG